MIIKKTIYGLPGVTSGSTLGASVVEAIIWAVPGLWKKYNINPVANKKWKPNIDPAKIKKYLDFLNAGRSQNISTAPEIEAAIRTRSHCSQLTWMVQKIATGM